MNWHIIAKMKTNTIKTISWQAALINAVTDPAELLRLLDLDMQLLDAAKAAAERFPLKVPHGFIARMQKGNSHDPLLQQILPIHAELENTPGYSNDPLLEANVNPIPGLLHKYQNRVLLTFIGTCAINCRYCFRREFPYADNNPGTEGWDKALEYVAQNKMINEVILSGGDPLVAPDKMLQNFTEKLNAISHVKRLRIHSRIPIVLPERITAEFIGWISQLKQKPVLVVHCNHPQEINAEVKAAARALTQAGVTLLNQSVLLKGINDDAETLMALSETLFEIHIQPYYLHLLDKVNGTAHFDIDLEQAKDLHRTISQRLSGYLVPKLVFEQPGAPSKIEISTEFCTG
jgi:EF-P beta-lysylation protein EpmB